MGRSVWIEVALNGAWTRQRQPLMPVTRAQLVEEAVACADEGAAVVHLHAYDDAGRPREAYDLYAPVVEAISSRRDVVVYPTVPMAVGPSATPVEGRARYAVVDRLARAGLVEWAVVDPGSVVLATVAELADGGDGMVHANAPADVRAGLAVCAEHRLVPSFAVYEPGFTGLGSLLAARAPASPRPVYRSTFSTGSTFGLPPAGWALDAHLRLLGECDPGATWLVAGLGVELAGLREEAVSRGGHVRVGLEDAPLGCTRGNAGLVAEARRSVEAAGARPASAAEVRAATGAGRR
ncbi:MULTISPECIES: 3-keto-5-aminohexanoate cleavage protein [unclassified Geodermatophilus]